MRGGGCLIPDVWGGVRERLGLCCGREDWFVVG